MNEELYFKLVEDSMKHESYLTTNFLIFFLLAGLITLVLCSGAAYYSPNRRYEPDSKFPKLFHPSTVITIILLMVFAYNARQCASYPATQDIERMLRDLNKIKEINAKTAENK